MKQSFLTREYGDFSKGLRNKLNRLRRTLFCILTEAILYLYLNIISANMIELCGLYNRKEATEVQFTIKNTITLIKLFICTGFVDLNPFGPRNKKVLRKNYFKNFWFILESYYFNSCPFIYPAVFAIFPITSLVFQRILKKLMQIQYNKQTVRIIELLEDRKC